MHIITKKILAGLAIIVMLSDIFGVVFALVYHITRQHETYELAQENHHDLIIIKHKLNIED